MHGGTKAATGQLATPATCWADDVAAGDAGPLKAIFTAHGAQGPVLRWRPVRDDLQPEPLKFLLTHWSALRQGRSVPLAGDIDALKMRPALGYVLLLDILEGGQDFRYRLFGTIIAAVSGFDLTGKLMSAHPASSYIVDFYFATCRAVLRRREPLATVHSPPIAVSTTVWHRLVLPLADANGNTIRLLIGVVPVARDGEAITAGW